jgi:Lamin Tail Domain
MSHSVIRVLCAAACAGALAAAAMSASAAIVITEADPFGSNGSDGYSADWFELTNTGSSAVSIAGWSMVDNHAATPMAA